jgi:hypothetical protein
MQCDEDYAAICRELHKDLRIEYAKYAKVFPLAQLLRVKVPSKWYRRAVGGTEIFSGKGLKQQSHNVI